MDGDGKPIGIQPAIVLVLRGGVGADDREGIQRNDRCRTIIDISVVSHPQ